jgi:hypothetical protein
MRLLVKHGADPLFVLRGEYVTQRGSEQAPETVSLKETVTTLMAATGMGGGRVAPWVAIPRSQREALTLDAVKLAADLGVDINAVNTDGRTALDAAKAARYDSVVKFLVAKGAKPGRSAN